jgi:hypothetical protein
MLSKDVGNRNKSNDDGKVSRKQEIAMEICFTFPILNIFLDISGVPRGISITATDENETKLNMQIFMLSTVMAFTKATQFSRSIHLAKTALKVSPVRFGSTE